MEGFFHRSTIFCTPLFSSTGKNIFPTFSERPWKWVRRRAGKVERIDGREIKKSLWVSGDGTFLVTIPCNRVQLRLYCAHYTHFFLLVFFLCPTGLLGNGVTSKIVSGRACEEQPRPRIYMCFLWET